MLGCGRVLIASILLTVFETTAWCHQGLLPRTCADERSLCMSHLSTHWCVVGDHAHDGPDFAGPKPHSTEWRSNQSLLLLNSWHCSSLSGPVSNAITLSFHLLLGDLTFEQVNPTSGLLGCWCLRPVLRQSEWLSHQCALDSSQHHFHQTHLCVQWVQLLAQTGHELFPSMRAGLN